MVTVVTGYDVKGTLECVDAVEEFVHETLWLLCSLVYGARCIGKLAVLIELSLDLSTVIGAGEFYLFHGKDLLLLIFIMILLVLIMFVLGFIMVYDVFVTV